MSNRSWPARVWAEFHADNLTRAGRDVLLTLHTYRGAGGVAWPSHATLAQRCDCDVRTVQRALQQGQRLDLVSWAERRVRSGWRWLRMSNLYRFISPTGPVQAGMRAVFCRPATTRHFVGGGESLSNQGAQEQGKEGLAEMLRAAASLPDLLAARRRVIEARLAGI
jgi:hypothetical protein